MIRLEARCIFSEQNPEKYPTEAHIAVCSDDDVEYPSWLSNHWMQSVLARHDFSYHTLATKMNKKAVTESALEVIENYHVSLQMKQLLKINDPLYGFTSPYYIYSHD